MSEFDLSANNNNFEYSASQIEKCLTWLRGFTTGAISDKEKEERVQEYFQGIYSELSELRESYAIMSKSYELMKTKYEAVRP